MDRKAHLFKLIRTFDGARYGHRYSDLYFRRSAEVLASDLRDPVVTMQIFAKKEGLLCGIGEALVALRASLAGIWGETIAVDTLVDGDAIKPWEPVMHIHGRYRLFATMETALLGILARRTLVATNAAKTVQAAGDTPVIFMGARHEHPDNQKGDGYAVSVGGIKMVSTAANASYAPDVQVVGTMPHALIAAFGGDTVAAAKAFQDTYPEVPLIVLVDYHNDVINTSLEVIRAFEAEGRPLPAAVRIDTSEKLSDAEFGDDREGKYRGVNVELAWRLHTQLSPYGVGIVVSGGFNPAKIQTFERATYGSLYKKLPIHSYGVGSSILGHSTEGGLYNSFDFTGDIVKVDGQYQSKVGRTYKPNARFIRIPNIVSI